MRIATEGIVVVDLEVIDGSLRGDAGPNDVKRGGFLKARARVTSRSMWTDDGKMLAALRWGGASRNSQTRPQNASSQRSKQVHDEML